MTEPDTLNLPAVTTLCCTADAVLLANILPQRFGPSLKRGVVFTSTSVMTKQDTEIASERESLRMLAEAQQRIAAACEQHGIRWTILQPTLIYKEGRDTNFTSLSRLIRRFGFMPPVGGGPGLRQCRRSGDRRHRGGPCCGQPVLFLAGRRDDSYRETIGRIFDGLRLPRRMISVPPVLWRMAFALAQPLFPGATWQWASA